MPIFPSFVLSNFLSIRIEGNNGLVSAICVSVVVFFDTGMYIVYLLIQKNVENTLPTQVIVSSNKTKEFNNGIISAH